MIKMVRGFRTRLDQGLAPSRPLEVRLSAEGDDVYDAACFCLDGSDKLIDDSLMVFYNQRSSPEGAITVEPGGRESVFTVDLARLPDRVRKLAFTLSIEGDSTMSRVRAFSVAVRQDSESLELDLKGSDFDDERAVIALEIYRKDVWRLAAVAAGFKGGLPALVESYGAQVAEDSEGSGSGSSGPEELKPPPDTIVLSQLIDPAPKPAPPKPAEPKPAEPAPRGETPPSESPSQSPISESPPPSGPVGPSPDSSSPPPSGPAGPSPRPEPSSDPLGEALAGLSGLRARVALVFESGSWLRRLFGMYHMRDLVDRMLAIAARLDDERELDIWIGSTRLLPVTSENVSRILYNYDSSRYDFEQLDAATFDSLLENYQDSKKPVLVLLVSDAVFVQDDPKLRESLVKSASSPVFLSFLSLGLASEHFARNLGELKGRKTGNFVYSAMPDLSRTGPTELYRLILAKFPEWLGEARSKGILT